MESGRGWAVRTEAMGDRRLEGEGDRRWDGRDTRVGGIFRDSSAGRRVPVK